MIGWAILLNAIAAISTLASGEVFPAVLELISVAVLVYALRQQRQRILQINTSRIPRP